MGERAQISEQMSLVDDLADVLAHVVVGWEPLLGCDLAQHPSVVRVMARYRAAKATSTSPFGEVRS